MNQRYEPHHADVWDTALSRHLTLSQAVAIMNGMDSDLQMIIEALREKGLMRDNETHLGAVLRLIADSENKANG